MALEIESTLERIQILGIRAVTTPDLLAVVLAREESDIERCREAAIELSGRFSGERLADINTHELHHHGGLEPFETLRILAAMEIGRRAASIKGKVSREITSVEDAFQFFQNLRSDRQEHFCAAYLNTKGVVIASRTIHIGTLNMSLVGVREVFTEAVRSSAASLIVAHNHPSGDPTPSPEDIQITRKLAEVGELLDIPLQDHIIVGADRCVSLMREGHF